MTTTPDRHPSTRGKTLRYPAWLTVSAVTAIIVLLALAVYSVSERAVVELFGRQQAAVAAGQASRIEAALETCEKTMAVFASAWETAGDSHLRELSSELEGYALVVALVGPDDTVRETSPPGPGPIAVGTAIRSDAIVHAVRKMQRRFLGGFTIEQGRGGDSRTVASVGVPLLGPGGNYLGAVLALIDPAFLAGPVRADNHRDRFMILDESGQVVYNADARLVGASFNSLLADRTAAFEKFSYAPSRFIDIVYGHQGAEVPCIAAFAPVRLGVDMWWVVLVTPREKVTVPVRRTAFNILLGALGLMAVVIVTAFSVSRSGARRALVEEERRRARERQEWQSRLLREKKTIEGIVQGSPVAMFVIDKDHKVILWNKACTDLTGYSAEEMIGTDNYYKPFYESRRPFLADLIVDRNVDNFDFDALYGEGKVAKSETIDGAYEAVKHFPRLKGKDRHLHFLAAPIYDEKGDIVAAIETFLDVTHEVELTRNLQEYAETLENELQENIRLKQEVEQLYRYLLSILDSLPDKVYELNKDGIINYVSRQIRTGMFDPKGKHFTEYVAPEHREYAISKWEDAKRGIFRSYELDFTTKDGRKRYLLMTPGPVKGTDRFILVERDITELKELEKKYYESQKLAAIGQLSAGIAHEVRNPLSSIKMSLQILEKRMQPQGNDLKRFRIAQKEVEHLEKLVSDVLVYARPSEPSRVPCDMRSVVDQALAMVEKSIEDKNIDVRKNYPPDPGLVDVDPSMMGQALINVFQNAVDAMEDRGTLTVTIREDSHHTAVEVEDTGCGIDEADMPYIFNPFFTKKSYGTGLGLSQVVKIVDQHRGSVTVQSRKGQGTRFTITLPRNPGQMV